MTLLLELRRAFCRLPCAHMLLLLHSQHFVGCKDVFMQHLVTLCPGGFRPRGRSPAAAAPAAKAAAQTPAQDDSRRSVWNTFRYMMHSETHAYMYVYIILYKLEHAHIISFTC
jgi:hypothetical protein